MGEPEVEDDEVDARQIRAHADEELRGAFDGDRAVARAQEGRGESIPHEGGVVGDDNGFRGGHSGRRHAGRIGRADPAG